MVGSLQSHLISSLTYRHFRKLRKAWDDYVPTIELPLNLDTGKTSFELDSGQNPLDPIIVCFDLNDTGSSLLHDWNILVLR